MTPTEIKSLRHRLGWTQPKLAEWCGVTVRAVKFWEQGKYVPSRPCQLLLDSLAGQERSIHKITIEEPKP